MAALITDVFSFPENTALFLDFDGTLVGFKDDPDTVHLSTIEAELLVQVSGALSGAVALISGRDLRDLSSRVPPGIWRLGNHGMFKSPPGEIPPDKLPDIPLNLTQTLEDLINPLDGTWLEKKGPVAAIHYRLSPANGPILLSKLRSLKLEQYGYIFQAGNNVIDLKPRSANKGIALTDLMSIEPFKSRIPIMIGDDTTDEDAFLAASKLNGFGIKMGSGITQARYRLPSIGDLYRLLRTLL